MVISVNASLYLTYIDHIRPKPISVALSLLKTNMVHRYVSQPTFFTNCFKLQIGEAVVPWWYYIDYTAFKVASPLKLYLSSKEIVYKNISSDSCGPPRAHQPAQTIKQNIETIQNEQFIAYPARRISFSVWWLP